jgi:hypothetical protein
MHYIIILINLLAINTVYNSDSYDLTINNTMKINWKSICATCTVNSNDNNYSLIGGISQSPMGIIYDSTSLTFGGIISGFWSSECDVNIKNIQEEKDFFALPNNQLVFKLYSNYPNPFKRTTKIRYDIPYTSIVKLLIYDICGKEVKQLVNEKQDMGRYNISWDGKDKNGKECSAGVYFVSMKTENYKSIKKVLIAK